MRYFARIKKPSPIHGLWRNGRRFKANLQGTLFTLNRKSGQYEAEVQPENLGVLMKNPHVEVTVATEPVGEAVLEVTSAPEATDPVTMPAPELNEQPPAVEIEQTPEAPTA